MKKNSFIFKILLMIILFIILLIIDKLTIILFDADKVLVSTIIKWTYWAIAFVIAIYDFSDKLDNTHSNNKFPK